MNDNNWRSPTAVAVVILLAAQFATYRAVTQNDWGPNKAIASRIVRQSALLAALQPKNESNGSILETYLRDIRRDGLVPHAATKKKIDQLTANTEALLALIDAYESANRLGPMKTGADEFRRYAIAWIDRRNSVMDLYLLGGNLPPGDPEFPAELLEALQQTD